MNPVPWPIGSDVKVRNISVLGILKISLSWALVLKKIGNNETMFLTHFVVFGLLT